MNTPSLPKVLHIASGDLWAGAEVQLFTLVKTLHTRLGVPVSVVLFNHGALEMRLRSIDVHVLVIDESQLSTYSVIRHLIRIIRGNKPDIIHTHRIKENILGSIAALLAGGVPSIRTVHGNPRHGPYSHQNIKRIIGFINRLAGRYLQRSIVSVSEDLAEILSKDYPCGKIRVIENGIDIDDIYTNSASSRLISGTGTNAISIGLAGRLVPVKRADLFIEIARYILDHYTDLRAVFHIYGNGPLLESLRQQSHDLGTDSVVVFEGHVDNIHEQIRKVDMLLVTSDHEGLPMILLEAMSLRIAVIAHAVGGIPKLLDYGTCGILVRNQEAASYADEIHRLARSPEIRSSIAEHAFKRVTNDYSALKNAREYLGEYNAILEGIQ